MCGNFFKPKVDPNVARLAKAQQAEIAEKKKAIQTGITEQKQEDKEQAVTERFQKSREAGRGGKRRRPTLISSSMYNRSDFGTGRFS